MLQCYSCIEVASAARLLRPYLVSGLPMMNVNNRWVTRYPLLQKFFRGYLHQDFPEVYGSVPGALRTFKDDIGTAEYAKFADQWSGFINEIHDWPIAEITHIVSQDLGGAWNVTSRQELQTFSEIVKNSLK